MAESRIKGIEVELINDNIEFTSITPITHTWSIGVNAIINGIGTAISESQVVPYDKILKITSLSPEFTDETRYASSARSVKIIHDLVASIGQGGVINKDIADRLDKLEKNQFFERYDDTTIKTKYNIISDNEISAHGLNTRSGGSGEGGASYLKDLLDVAIVGATNDDILIYNGTHWVNKPQSSIVPDLSILENYLLKTEADNLYLSKDDASGFASAVSVSQLNDKLTQISDTYGDRIDALERVLRWFHLTEDEQAIYTEKNFYSEKEVSGLGLNIGGGGNAGFVGLGDIIGVSLQTPTSGDVFMFNGTHWTNVSQSELIPDLSKYATSDSLQSLDNRVKEVERQIVELSKDKFFFRVDGSDDVIYTPFNLYSEKQLSAYGLSYGSESGSSALLQDLLDVRTDGSSSGDILMYNGTHWINTPQSEIVPDIDTSAIATREWVEGQGYATDTDLRLATSALRAYADEQNEVLSAKIANILDWFTLSNGILSSKYSIASEGEISALKFNA